MNTTLNVWFCVNKNRDICMFLDIPERKDDKWIGKKPFINSVLYKQIGELVEKTKFGWMNDPECLTLKF